MAASVCRTEMEKFSGGTALLPWTRQVLAVLWDHLRLLLQVIYYTCMSVFQMFRFEVHVRITDETGEHIQHMTTTANSSESFLFSSNFCSDVGGKSTAEALLSSLRAEELCCGLVDDLVSGSEEGIFLGHQSTWKMGFPGDWNIFVSGGDSSDDGPRKNGEKASRQEAEEEQSSPWSSEEEQNGAEIDNEESKALWESLSKSSDPYNPFFFSACISTRTDAGSGKGELGDGDAGMMSVRTEKEEAWPPGLNIWFCRSDSESSWSSWTGSDGSSPDVDKEESDRLWDLFSSPEDPYHPLCFTASTANPPCRSGEPPRFEEESSFPLSEDEEELLWSSLGQKDDPYHPLNFQACVQTSSMTSSVQHEATPTKTLKTKTRRPRVSRPALPERTSKQHSHPDTILVPWRRPDQNQNQQTPSDQSQTQWTRSAQKQVRFSPVVQVHVMRTWPFARQASRRGHWEELARDRDRFQRRILEAERSIGYCLTPPHRQKVQEHLEGAFKNNLEL